MDHILLLKFKLRKNIKLLLVNLYRIIDWKGTWDAYKMKEILEEKGMNDFNGKGMIEFNALTWGSLG